MNLDWILQEELPEISADDRRRAVERVRAFVSGAVLRERGRCAQLCRDRGALWERTSMSTSTVPGAVAEARFRSNEARYLADLIEADDIATDEV
jgi:hypothetical protein